MSGHACGRRRFLEVVAHGGVLAGAAGLGIGCGSPSLSGKYAGGNVADLQVGDLKAVSGPLAIGRDAGGVWAMSLLCTHEDCDMSADGTVAPSGIVCNCHGSRFDAQGNVTAGPARSPLQHYQVTIDAAGAITVNADVAVSETTRTAVGA